MTGSGRFAPSPSGDLHLGNLRTALLAWLFARSTQRSFALRIEDLDRVADGAEARQIADLRSVGIDFDGTPVRQSERRELYDAALDRLVDADLVYECYCTRREILDAASAPHAPDGAYPGTCRNFTDKERAIRRTARPAALRLRADESSWTVSDLLHGEFTGVVDDFVLRRGDGIPAYNLAVVVDDGDQGIDQVVRADDLLTSAPRQAYLAGLLGIEPPQYVHVPLAVGPTGKRLAKRDGAVTLRDRIELGEMPSDVFRLIAGSFGVDATSARQLLGRWDSTLVPSAPWAVRLPP
ncbi:glutamyl-Q tRNA(Asp) synthetase [Rhodococcoides trifolii]|uniref:Glutamyl-Q tRNA(Asp) synthetase n=1 Tax=Rhodococcoides trifolii TaxID=908250 RepID=A0A917LF72_9NOCA|nr:tRNA glutamyl-Q(34) synthetase GluQRS [Rhodococcus trifolii]GGG18471.1 glutamyl-Q tRNA(Asp) synthetase [Rhodococcus trifolii]